MSRNKNNYDDLDCYTIKEVSRIVKVSTSTCYRWCEEDLIPNIKFTGDTVRIYEKEFCKFWEKKIILPDGTRWSHSGITLEFSENKGGE